MKTIHSPFSMDDLDRSLWAQAQVGVSGKDKGKEPLEAGALNSESQVSAESKICKEEREGESVKGCRKLVKHYKKVRSTGRDLRKRTAWSRRKK